MYKQPSNWSELVSPLKQTQVPEIAPDEDTVQRKESQESTAMAGAAPPGGTTKGKSRKGGLEEKSEHYAATTWDLQPKKYKKYYIKKWLKEGLISKSQSRDKSFLKSYADAVLD